MSPSYVLQSPTQSAYSLYPLLSLSHRTFPKIFFFTVTLTSLLFLGDASDASSWGLEKLFWRALQPTFSPLLSFYSNTFFFFFKQALHATWGLNSQPLDQESLTLQTEETRCPQIPFFSVKPNLAAYLFCNHSHHHCRTNKFICSALYFFYVTS